MKIAVYGGSFNPLHIGHYAIIRHLVEVEGFDLVYLGEALMFFSWPLLVLSAVTMLLFHLQIVNVEEDHLIAAFGQEYLSYRRQVNRYFGRKR